LVATNGAERARLATNYARIVDHILAHDLFKLIGPTVGYVHQGNDMGNEWNHSDDATDFPGDEFLLGYWLGRYIGAISGP